MGTKNLKIDKGHVMQYTENTQTGTENTKKSTENVANVIEYTKCAKTYKNMKRRA